jgi:SagB-type dehydrogenase family enzyme
MSDFRQMLHALPTMGVGFGFNFDLPLTAEDVSRLRRGDLGGFDYIEVQPPHVLLFHDMWQIIKAAPTIIHCSQFSLASSQPKKDPRFATLTRNVMVQSNTPWFAEHISLSQFPGGDTKHFFLPYLDGQIREDIVRNAVELQREMKFPLLLENAPRLFDVTCEPVEEGAFLSEIVKESQCGYLVDLSSARKTCSCLGYSLDEYINSMPVDLLIEMHVGDIDLERSMALDLVRNTPVKAVTLEANLSRANDAELAEFVEAISAELKRKASLRVSISAQATDQPETSVPLSTRVDLSASVEFSKGTSIVVSDDHIALHSHGKNPTFLPAESASLIAEILQRKPLAELIDVSKPDLGMTLVTLSTHAAKSSDEVNDGGWPTWGLAEAFHKSIRSSENTQFDCKEAFEARLSSPENQAKRPRFAKEYSLHPQFKLASPKQPREDSFQRVLFGRRTCRQFSQQGIPLEVISNVLYHSCGWTVSGAQQVGGMPVIRKTSPSPGSMASVEAYLIALKVNDLPPGIFHYSLVSHVLELLDGEYPSNWLISACGDQEWIGDCAAAILFCGVPARLAWKYATPKAYQVMMMEVGHLSQTALLSATAEGLGCFCTSALREAMFEQRIGLDPLDETPLMLVGMGHAQS